MERIRKAVEQASKDRVANAGAESPDVDPNDRSVRMTESHSGYVPPTEVNYTQTRNIIVSPVTRRNNRLAAAIPGHPLRDTYRMLRTRVLKQLKANGWNTVAVTSPATGSGKSLTAINLAISLAMDLSHLVLLVDGDLRKPSIHNYFGYQPEFGLNDYLANPDLPLSSILFHPDIDRLTVLPGRVSIDESAEQLSSPRALSLLKELSSRYPDRLILVDLPPVLTVDDALSLAPNIDCMLMVAENGETTREDLYKAIDLLDGIPILGTVLNKSDIKLQAD